LAELRARLAAKRAEQQRLELEESKQREALRRISGKEITKAKELQAELDMKRALQQKQREKKEEAEARARVKAQIEADRKARAEKVSLMKLGC
jgi:hypothetical protein